MNKELWGSGKSSGGLKKKSVNSNRPPSGTPFSFGVSGVRVSSARAQRNVQTTERKPNQYPNSYGGGGMSDNSDFLPSINANQKSPIQLI